MAQNLSLYASSEEAQQAYVQYIVQRWMFCNANDHKTEWIRLSIMLHGARMMGLYLLGPNHELCNDLKFLTEIAYSRGMACD